MTEVPKEPTPSKRDMSLTAMFLIPFAVAVLCYFTVMIITGGRHLRGEPVETIAAFFMGGILLLYLEGWIVPGICYLVGKAAKQQMKRTTRAYVASIMIIVFSHYFYWGVRG